MNDIFERMYEYSHVHYEYLWILINTYVRMHYAAKNGFASWVARVALLPKGSMLKEKVVKSGDWPQEIPRVLRVAGVAPNHVELPQNQAFNESGPWSVRQFQSTNRFIKTMLLTSVDIVLSHTLTCSLDRFHRFHLADAMLCTETDTGSAFRCFTRWRVMRTRWPRQGSVSWEILRFKCHDIPPQAMAMAFLIFWMAIFRWVVSKVSKFLATLHHWSGSFRGPSCGATVNNSERQCAAKGPPDQGPNGPRAWNG